MKKIASALIALLIAGIAQAASVTVSLSVTPLTSPGPIAPTLTWNSTGAATCTASDGWTGAKLIAGTETLPLITKTTKFSLTCSSATGPATVAWTPPTQNTDGSPLTNIASWQMMIGPTATTLSRGPLINGAGITSALIEAPIGTQFFSVRTVNASGIESDNAVPPASKNVLPEKATGAVTVSVDVKPNPPTNVTVQ